MNQFVYVLLIVMFFISCSKDDPLNPAPSIILVDGYDSEMI
jgi:hypothetical protein